MPRFLTSSLTFVRDKVRNDTLRFPFCEPVLTGVKGSKDAGAVIYTCYPLETCGYKFTWESAESIIPTQLIPDRESVIPT